MHGLLYQEGLASSDSSLAKSSYSLFKIQSIVVCPGLPLVTFPLFSHHTSVTKACLAVGLSLGELNSFRTTITLSHGSHHGTA